MPTDPQDIDTEELLALGRRQFQRGDFDGALAKLKRLASLPTQPEALALLARTYAQLGLMERARKCFRRFLESNPDSAHETFELGATYFDEGDDKRALGHWKRALELQPTHPPALFFSAMALSRSGKAADARHQLDVLLKSASADNLYVRRAGELLKSLDGDLPVSAPSPNPYGGHGPSH